MAYTPAFDIDVICWGKKVGALAADPASRCYAFEYYPSFIKSGIELSPLSLPLSSPQPKVFSALSPETFYRLPPFIADALPDRFGNDLIDAWMAEQGVSKESITSLDRLAYMGKRAMGALEFRPAARSESVEPTAIELQSLVELARQSLKLNLMGEASVIERKKLEQLISIGSSAGGARAKAVVGWNPETHDFISGQFDVPKGYEHWILKFDIDSGSGLSRQYGKVEFAYYLMARECGIRMKECRLQEAAGASHFMTRRFDRNENSKVHMQTLCAIAELDFRSVGAFSSVQLFETANDLGLGYDTIDEIFDRMAFNVCMANNDDHTKNWSFLLEEGGSWQLAPAYDLTYSYAENNPWLSRHFMAVNGKFKDITREDLLLLAERYSVSDPSERIDKIVKVARAWPDFAHQAGLSSERIDEIGTSIRGCVL